MDWTNIDLNSPYEASQNMLDPYNFDTLLMEVEHNLREITAETVRKQALESIEAKYREAKSILESNLLNITNKALEYRAIE